MFFHVCPYGVVGDVEGEVVGGNEVGWCVRGGGEVGSKWEEVVCVCVRDLQLCR